MAVQAGNELRNRESLALDERFKTLFAKLSGTVPTQQSVLEVVRGMRDAPEIAIDAQHKISVSAEKPAPEGGRPAQDRNLRECFGSSESTNGKPCLGLRPKAKSATRLKKLPRWGRFRWRQPTALARNRNIRTKGRNRGGQSVRFLVVDRHKKAQYGARADGKYEYDTNQRLGNLLGPTLRARDWSVTPKAYLNYPFIDPNQSAAAARDSQRPRPPEWNFEWSR